MYLRTSYDIDDVNESNDEDVEAFMEVYGGALLLRLSRVSS